MNETKGCVEEASAVAQLHNKILSVELDKLKKQLTEFKYSYVDFFDLSLDLISNPSKYGKYSLNKFIVIKRKVNLI